MKILSVVASGRQRGTIDRACYVYSESIAKDGDEHERLNLFDYNIKPCVGCLKCCTTKECVLKDDFETIFHKLSEADLILLGTPIYCHDVPGVFQWVDLLHIGRFRPIKRLR